MEKYTRIIHDRLLEKLDKFNFPEVFFSIPVPQKWQEQKGIVSEMMFYHILENSTTFSVEKTSKKQEKMSIDFILNSKHMSGYSIYTSLKSGFESYLEECSDFLKELELGDSDSSITSYIYKGNRGIPAVIYLPPQSMRDIDNPEKNKQYEAFIMLQLFGMLQHIISVIYKKYPESIPKKQKSLVNVCRTMSDIIHTKFKNDFSRLTETFTSENEKIIIKYNMDTIGVQY